MATRNSAYWEKRFKTLENSLHREGLECYAEIEEQYRKAERELQKSLRSWYQRFADNNEISLAEARKWLRGKDLEEFKWTVQDYIKAGEENALDGRWMKQLENASAKYHISRLESLELEMQQSLEVMFGNQLDSLDAAMRKVYQDGYYHTAFEIQKGWGVGWDFAQLDERKISKVIKKPWAADGKDFSERIWENREKLVNELNQTVVQNMMLGQDSQKAIDEIAKKMQTSKSNAGRLVMTEEAYFSSAAQEECFKELDVEQYQIVATLDNKTSEICQEMDGKVFPMSGYEAGTTAPPFHPNCRSTTIPYFDEWYGLDRERAARDEEGIVYNIPADMNYERWKSRFVDAEKYRTDVTSAYLKNASPGTGNIIFDTNYDKNGHREEISVAKWINENLGGDIKLLTESTQDNIKTPDYVWDGKMWELKTITTEKASNSAIKKALKQISQNPGGVILDFKDNKFSSQLLWNTVDRRMEWNKLSDKIDILVLSKGKLKSVKRY